MERRKENKKNKRKKEKRLHKKTSNTKSYLVALSKRSKLEVLSLNPKDITMSASIRAFFAFSLSFPSTH
jgi:hypothetical protein